MAIKEYEIDIDYLIEVNKGNYLNYVTRGMGENLVVYNYKIPREDVSGFYEAKNCMLQTLRYVLKNPLKDAYGRPTDTEFKTWFYNYFTDFRKFDCKLDALAVRRIKNPRVFSNIFCKSLYRYKLITLSEFEGMYHTFEPPKELPKERSLLSLLLIKLIYHLSVPMLALVKRL